MNLLPDIFLVFTINTQLSNKFANQSLDWMTLVNASASATMSWLGFWLLFCGGVFIQNCDHHWWCTVSLSDLKEGVIMNLSFFALSAIVEILAHSALVANSNNWRGATTIALHTWMHNLWVFWFFDNLLWNQFIENFWHLFVELLLDQALDGCARHVFGCTSSALAFLAFLALSFDRLTCELCFYIDSGNVNNRNVRWLNWLDVFLLRNFFNDRLLRNHLNWLFNGVFSWLDYT